MTSCAVLVGIVTRNRCTLLPKSVTSALKQTGASVHVAVLDDGSIDDTPRVESEFPNVTWKRREKSLGYMAARNFLMENAPEEFFVGLDDDAWFLNGDEIDVACSVMKSKPDVAAIAFDILSPDKPSQKQRTETRATSSFIGCGHMLRLSAVRQVGGYEQMPGSYGVEEKDLCLRLIDAGYAIVQLPGVHVWHDKTAVARQFNDQYQSGVCNDFVMALRRTPTAMLPIALVSKMYRHFHFGIRHKLLRETLRGFVLFVKTTPRVWPTRKPVRASTLRTFMKLRLG